MKKKPLICAIIYIVIAVAWGFVAYEHHLDADLKCFYALIVMTVAYFILAMLKLYECKKR